MGIISLNLLHPIALNQKMINNLKIGVMQGRLLPKYKGRYQAHPVGYWQEEFKIASLYNLYCIEFILDYNLLKKLKDRLMNMELKLSQFVQIIL